jgi:hypothetical protein
MRYTLQAARDAANSAKYWSHKTFLSAKQEVLAQCRDDSGQMQLLMLKRYLDISAQAVMDW